MIKAEEQVKVAFGHCDGSDGNSGGLEQVLAYGPLERSIVGCRTVIQVFGRVSSPVFYKDCAKRFYIDSWDLFDMRSEEFEFQAFVAGWSSTVLYGGPELGVGSFAHVRIFQDKQGAVYALKIVELPDEFRMR